MTIDAVIFYIFLIVNLGFGLTSSRGIKDIREYAIGERNFSTATIVATIVATWISGDYLFAQTTEVYKHGLYYMWGSTLCELVYFSLIAFVFAPRMGEFLGKLSIAEAMGSIYGKKIRIITAISGFIGVAGMISVQLKVAGLAFEYATGLSSYYGSIIAGVLITVYSALGGIKSVTFTDVIQFVTFGVVIPIIIYFLLNSLSSIDILTATITTSPLFDYTQVFNFSQEKSIYFLFIFFFYAIPSFNPAVFQRISMARNTSQVTKSFGISAFTCFSLSVSFSVIGILTLAIHPNINPEDVIKTIISDYSIIPGIKGLILVGIMAMIMSTVDSYINSTAILLVHDVLKPLKIKVFCDNELFAARIFAFVIGAISIILSLREGSLLSLIISAYSFYVPILTAPFIMTVFGFRSSEKSVMLGMLSGFLTTIIWNYFDIQTVNGVVPAVFMNFIALISSHYLLKQPGGWVGIQDDSQLVYLRNQRKLRFKNFIKELKAFNLLNVCNNNYPKGEGHIAIFGVFVMIVTFSIVNTLPQQVHHLYSHLLDVVYPLTLFSATALITYPLWLEKWKNTRLIGLAWNVIAFSVLICFSCLIVIISNFSEIQLTVFLVNVLVISALVRWQWALFLTALGICIVTFCYINYIAIDGYHSHNSILISQFKIIYLLVLISSSLVLFLKPKQKSQELTEQKLDYLEHKIIDNEGELQRLIALRNELLFNINHELHTPITSITSLGQVLDDKYEDFSDEKRRQIIRDIANSSAKLQMLIDNIFDLSKISCLNPILNKSRIDLGNLIYGCFDRCQKVHQANKDQEFTLNLEDDIYVLCDAHLIQCTIDNLIANAIKYCKKGKIVINLMRKEEFIEFSIADQGIGIPKEEIYDIFGSFIVSSNTKTLAGGRGIGLALCKKAIEAHGGKIWVESDSENGTVFKFTLPNDK